MSMSCPHCQKAVPDAIPKHRLDEESNKRKAAEDRVKELEPQAKLADKQADKIAELEASRGELEGKLSSTTERHSIELTARDLGIDPELVDNFVGEWRKTGGEDGANRPAFADYIAGAQENPETVPKYLRAWIPSADGGQAGDPGAGGSAPTGGQGSPAGAFRERGGSGRSTGSQSAPAITAENIRAMKQRGADGLAEYRRARQAIGEQAGIAMPALPGDGDS